MKRVFAFVVAVCLATGVVAQPNQPSKKDIRQRVVMSYYDIINCARYRMPVSMLENIFVYSDWYAELDDKTKACAEDEMQRWSRRHKLQKERFKEYMDVALAMVTDENYDVYDAETVANVYLDAVAELLDRGEEDAACNVLIDLYIFIGSYRVDMLVEEYMLAWQEHNPIGFEIVMNSQLPELGNERIVAYLGGFFGEDYLVMDDAMLAECYIRHIEGLAESQVAGHEMNLMRNSLVISYIYTLNDDDSIYIEALTEWMENNPEKVAALNRAIQTM